MTPLLGGVKGPLLKLVTVCGWGCLLRRRKPIGGAQRATDASPTSKCGPSVPGLPDCPPHPPTPAHPQGPSLWSTPCPAFPRRNPVSLPGSVSLQVRCSHGIAFLMSKSVSLLYTTGQAQEPVACPRVKSQGLSLGCHSPSLGHSPLCLVSCWCSLTSIHTRS